MALEQAALNTLTDQLKAQQDVLAEIEKSTYWDEQIATINTILLKELNSIKNWLTSVQGTTTWENQILAIEQETVAQLRQIESDLKFLFLKTVEQTGAAGYSIGLQQRMVGALESITTYNLRLPVPMHVTNFYDAPKQRGGLVGIPSGLHYAQGGMVPVMLEPGERVYFPPVPAGVAELNRAVPRFGRGGGFTVPGSGTGDTFHAWAPSGSFALNSRASGARGFQDGGPVQGGNGNGEKTETHHHHVDNRTIINNPVFRSKQDAHEIMKMFEDWKRDRYRSDI